MRKLNYNPMQSIASASITGTYQALGSALPNACVIVKIINNSTADVTITTDITITNGEDFAPLASGCVYDVSANHTSDELYIPAGRQYFVKGTAGTGSVYLVSQYVA